MLKENQLIEIQEHLKNGKEVLIVCESLNRQVELEKQTFDFPGRLRIRLIGEV